jgi:hypothetical protein
LYKKLLHKYNFGQAHCVELLIMVHAKFNLNFLDLPTSSSQILRFETISGIYLNKQEKSLNSAWAESGPWSRSFGHSGRRSGGTQSACFPGPRPKRLGLRASGPRPKRCGLARSHAGRRGTHQVRDRRACGPHGGAVDNGSSVDGKRQGPLLKHHR